MTIEDLKRFENKWLDASFLDCKSTVVVDDRRQFSMRANS